MRGTRRCALCSTLGAAQHVVLSRWATSPQPAAWAQVGAGRGARRGGGLPRGFRLPADFGGGEGEEEDEDDGREELKALLKKLQARGLLCQRRRLALLNLLAGLKFESARDTDPPNCFTVWRAPRACWAGQPRAQHAHSAHSAAWVLLSQPRGAPAQPTPLLLLPASLLPQEANPPAEVLRVALREYKRLARSSEQHPGYAMCAPSPPSHPSLVLSASLSVLCL